ncbi:MAG: hypothetical protein JXN59_17135 [Anaerolineae bacterium]|nr:hypothetical protein [Anaerolineae bacterium]
MLHLLTWRNRLALLITLAVAGALVGLTAPVSAQSDDDIIMIFMHHSTGRRLIAEGLLKEGLAEHNIALWDHGYNEDGLVTPEWDWLGTNWDIPGDNTDPDGWVTVFNQPVTSPPENAFSHMLEYDVIAFKSCYPNADIFDDGMLETYKEYYLEIRDIMDQHPDKLFIPFTIPPLVPNQTSPDAAARAMEWAAFLTSDEYLEGHPNIVTFDFFSLLADENGYLREAYRVSEDDSHPNPLANETVGPLFVEFVVQALADFTPGEAPVIPAPAEEPAGEPAGEPVEEEPVEEPAAETETEPAADPAGSSMPLALTRVETISPCFPPFDEASITNGICNGTTWEWQGDGTLTWEVTHSADPYANALEIAFDLAMDDYGGMGFHFAPNPDWAATEGIAFLLQADQPDLTLNFSLGVHDPAHPEEDEADATPFEVHLTTPEGAGWQTVIIPWSEFTKARWWGEAGVEAFDPANVVWASFGVGESGVAQAGTIWIADLHLLSAE